MLLPKAGCDRDLSENGSRQDKFYHRNRVTYRKSVSISADVEHNTPHSYFPCIFSMYECFVSRDLSCDPFERVAKVVRCLSLLDAIPPVDICCIQMCFSFRDIPLGEPQSLDAQSSTVMMSYIGVKSQRMHEEVADVVGAMQRVHEWSKLYR